MVYQWDHCTHPDRIKNATKRMWKHDKSVFGLYKSAELHTSFRQRLPLAVYGVGLALLMLGYLAWVLYGRYQARQAEANAADTVGAPVQSAPVQAQASTIGQGGSSQNGTWPVLNVSAKVDEREPYHDRALHLDGCWIADRELPRCMFGISIAGVRLGTVSTAQLLAAGYSWRLVAPCSGVLIYQGKERSVTCDSPKPPAYETEPQKPPIDQTA